MRHPWVVPIGILVLCSLTPRAAADDTRFSIEAGVGYAALDFDTADEQLDEADNGYVNIGVSWSPYDSAGLKLGVGIVSSYYDEVRDLQSPPLEPDFDEEYSELSLWMIEGRVGWYQPIGDYFFIEPSVGAGILVGRIETGQRDSGSGWDYDVVERDTDANLAVRPMVAAGVRWGGHYTLGVDTSYLVSSLDFDEDLGGDIREWRTGVFFRFTF